MSISNFIQKSMLLLILIFSIVSCNQDNDDDNLVTDPGGSADYFINNETAMDIVVIFQKSEPLGSEIDTTDVIERDASVKIFRDVILGDNPTPEDSYKEIKFFESPDLENPFKVLLPIDNEDWTIVSKDFDSIDFYGNTIYEIKLMN